jgi:hypothetical protein
MQAPRIQAQDIVNGLSPLMQNFLAIESQTFPARLQPMMQAFWEATRLIEASTRIRKKVFAVFSISPFNINLPLGAQLSLVIPPDIVSIHVEDTIYYDCRRIDQYEYRLQVAIFLEELVHVFMNVSDEDLVKEIVTYLYSGVQLQNGRYTVT